MKQIYKATFILSIFTFSAALILSLINNLTADRIRIIAENKEKAALSQVLPGFTIDAKKDKKELSVKGNKITYWIGTKKANNKTQKGVAFIAKSKGYSGDIKVMVGIDELFEIQGISVLGQTETPGLGARCEEIASKTTILDFILGNKVADEPTVPWFQEQFTGLKSNKPINIVKKGDWNKSMRSELLQKNSISAITGATITTAAVKNGIENFTSLLKPIIIKAKQQTKEEK